MQCPKYSHCRVLFGNTARLVAVRLSMLRILALTAVALLTIICGAAGGRAQTATPARPPVELQMQNVNLHLDKLIVLEVRRLRGQMVPLADGKPVILDDLNSFVTRISSAEIAMSTAVLSDLLNKYVFAYPDAPLKQIVVTFENGRIKQRGVMHKGVDMPFEVEGTIDVTASGQIRFHADKVRSAHIPFKGLMHLLGEDLSKLIKVRSDRGLTLDGDDILLNPTGILPPPRIEGRLTAVRIEGDRIVQTFESGAAKALVPPLKARNYIYHRGGVLRFGKLTMTDADLEIIDQSPRTPFDFSLPDYSRQLVAGYSKNTAAQGLIVFMPDWTAIAQRH